MEQRPNYITPAGYAALRGEYERLFATERPALVDTIAWAAGNGDRSENGDYIYGRKRLREIDRRVGWRAKRRKAAKLVDPAQAQDRGHVWFGATVTIAD
ncbi:MAG: transcription elongation factor GreB, partial [Sphingomonas sp.]